MNDAKNAIEELGAEKRIVNEVMADAVDVGVDHKGINDSQDDHDPEGCPREEEEKSKEVAEMEKARESRNGVPPRMGEDFRVRQGPFYSDGVSVHEGI